MLIADTGAGRPRYRSLLLAVILIMLATGLAGSVVAAGSERIDVPLLDSPVRGPADAPGGRDRSLYA